MSVETRNSRITRTAQSTEQAVLRVLTHFLIGWIIELQNTNETA